MEPKVFDPSLMENRFRHEFKYECSYAQLKNLQCRLSGLIPLDPHAGEVASITSGACILMVTMIGV